MSSASASEHISFRPYRAIAAELISAGISCGRSFSLLTPGPVFVWPGGCLPWSEVAIFWRDVKLDVKRSTDRSPGRPSGESLAGLRPGGCRTPRSVCVGGRVWADGLGFCNSLPEGQDYRKFSNLRFSPLNDRFRKWERKSENPTLPFCSPIFRREICGIVPSF